MFNPPKVGSVVTITTQFPDYYQYRTSNVREAIYSDVEILPPEPWFKHHQIKIVGNEKHPFRVIDMQYVVDITEGVESKASPDSYIVEITGSKGNQYIVNIKEGKAVSCSCPGYQFRHSCRHLKEAVDFPDENKDNTHTINSNLGDSMAAGKTLTWNDRFALIDHYKPTDQQICNAFGIDSNALGVARNFRKSGQFVATEHLDVKSYGHLFGVVSKTKQNEKPTMTTTVKPTSASRPVTATKKTSQPKKRGRKGSKIKDAFAAIPSEPTNADTFISSHNVSLAVMRQGKRFDPVPETGSVRVRKDKDSGELMIWRETA